MTPLRVTLVPGVLAAAAGLFATLMLAQNLGVRLGLPLDDAWIHAAFARNLAQNGTWGLFHNVGSGGESSVLWPLLLALGELVRGGAPRTALLLGGAAWLLLPAVAGTLASTRRRAAALSLAVGACGPLLFAALSGMETIPALLVGLVSLRSFSGGNTRSAGLWAAVATALRPDFILLLLILAVGQLDHRRATSDQALTSWRATLLPLVPGAVAAVLVLVALAGMEGRFPPATLAGRRWIVGLSPQPGLSDAGAGAAALVESWVRALVAELGWGHARGSMDLRGGVALGFAWKLAVAAALVPGALAVARQAGGRRDRAVPRLVVLWTLNVLVFYALVLPDRGHAGRYQPQVYVLFLLLAVEGIGALFTSGPRMRTGALVVLVLFGGGLVAGQVYVVRTWAEGVGHIEGVHVRAARELAGQVPANAPVAVFDVGAVAYHHRGPLVDLSGLSDPTVLPALAAGRVAPLLARRDVHHLLLPHWWNEGAGSLLRRLGLEVATSDQILAEYQSSRRRWGPAFALTGHAFPRLVLSRWEPPAP